MSDLFGYISSWSFMKWIVLVLIAGFVGQFGKIAAEDIAKKIRTSRGKKEIAPEAPIKTQIQQSSPDTPVNTPGQQSSPDEMTDKKILKSMDKTRKKDTKKKIGLIIGAFRKRL